MRRIILEMGTGNDLYGMDYTKAGRRAIQDALHHSSITLFKSRGLDHKDMEVRVTIAVAEPDKLDIAALEAELPRGRATVTAVKGGLNVADAENAQTHVIATAAIEAFLPDQSGKWVVSE